MNKILNIASFLSISLFAVPAFPDVSLPIHSLRLQEGPHCGVYAMSHALESRALVRSSLDTIINNEKDLMYWINYDRMVYIYKTKKDFFLDKDNEAAWQIESWEALLKHGKAIHSSKPGTPDVWYPQVGTYKKALPYMPEPRPAPDPTLISIPDLVARLKTGFTSDSEADAYIRDYLNRWYGAPVTQTDWMGSTVDIDKTAPLLMDSDFSTTHDVDSLVLIKPVTDGNYGWVRYLNDRYPGYRYDSSKILDLVRQSLDNHWPVTFDMGVHAMTIVGYKTVYWRYFYAIADSWAGAIAWYDPESMLAQFNLVSFFQDSIPGALPPRNNLTMSESPVVDVNELPPQ